MLLVISKALLCLFVVAFFEFLCHTCVAERVFVALSHVYVLILCHFHSDLDLKICWGSFFRHNNVLLAAVNILEIVLWLNSVTSLLKTFLVNMGEKKQL